MVTETPLHSDLAIPPGEYLEEVLGSLGMSKDELAMRMGRPATKLSPIFKGGKAITPDTALQLEKVVGVPAHIWLGLETEYRLTLARQAETQEGAQCRSETGILGKFCYAELVKLGMVPKVTRPEDKVRELQRFFGVASLAWVRDVRRYQVALRCARSRPEEHAPHALAAWLRMGEIKAASIRCRPFDKSSLRTSLREIRALTMRIHKHGLTELASLLAGLGVVLVIVPHFPGTRAQGATFWLNREKAVVMVTPRGKWADIFWFSLFHELGHVLLHDRREVFIENQCSLKTHQVLESEADSFAANQLISEKDYRKFLSAGNFYENSVVSFAERIGIHPGIVVGRLQHDRHLLPQFGNNLRVRLQLTERGQTVKC